MRRGEKLATAGMIGTFVVGLTFDGPYWYVGVTIVAICLLVMTTGWAIYHAQYVRKELRKEIRKRRMEETDQAKQRNKDITFDVWIGTRKLGTF